MSRFQNLVHALQWLVTGLALVGWSMPFLAAMEDIETKSGFVNINLPDDPTDILTITTVQPNLKQFVYFSLVVLFVSGLTLPSLELCFKRELSIRAWPAASLVEQLSSFVARVLFTTWHLGSTGSLLRVPTVRLTTLWNRASCKARRSC